MINCVNLKLSFTETDPTFSDQSKYNGFYRIVPGKEQHNDLCIHLIRRFNWTRIGTVYLTKAKYTLSHNLLIRELDKIVNVTMSRSIPENQKSNQYETVLNEFIADDIKIIIGLFDDKTTIKFFCEVFKKKMYGKNYQWIILGSKLKRFLYSDDTADSLECTREQILTALNGTLKTSIVEYSHEYNSWFGDGNHDKNNANDLEELAGIIDKSAEFESHYQSIVESYLSRLSKDLKNSPNKKSCIDSYFHGYAFDVVLAIFKTFSLLIESKKLACDENVFERNLEWFSLLTNAFNKISFKGVTVSILINYPIISFFFIYLELTQSEIGLFFFQKFLYRHVD
jgi:hypothetical protein